MKSCMTKLGLYIAFATVVVAVIMFGSSGLAAIAVGAGAWIVPILFLMFLVSLFRLVGGE